MIVLRMMLSPRIAFAQMQSKRAWLPFLLLALVPPALGLAGAFLSPGALPIADRSPVSPRFLLAGATLVTPLAWMAGCALTALLLWVSGTLVSRRTPFRLLFAIAAGATLAPSLRSLTQAAVSIAAGRFGAIDDSILVFLGSSAPTGLVGALVGAMGLFRIWQGGLLVLGVSSLTEVGLARSLLQVAPAWLVGVGIAAASAGWSGG